MKQVLGSQHPETETPPLLATPPSRRIEVKAVARRVLTVVVSEESRKVRGVPQSVRPGPGPGSVALEDPALTLPGLQPPAL